MTKHRMTMTNIINAVNHTLSHLTHKERRPYNVIAAGKQNVKLQ